MLWFTNKKTKKAQEEKQREYEELIKKAHKIVDEKALEDEIARKEPFLDLKGLVQEEDGKIKIELDWDDNFIKKLKESGYTGASDDILIQKYLLELTKSISDDMSGDSDYE